MDHLNGEGSGRPSYNPFAKVRESADIRHVAESQGALLDDMLHAKASLHKADIMYQGHTRC